MIVKTLYTLLILMTVALSVHAQTPVTPPVPTIPKRTTRAEATERAAAAASATNPAARVKNVAVTSTNAEAPATVAAAPAVPVPPSPAVAPPAVTPPPAIPAPSATGTPAAVTPPAPAVGTTAATPAANANAEESFAPGLFKFQDSDLVQILEIYQELTGRTVMRPAGLPQAKITMRSQTPLTRPEAIAALDTILAMNQITMINQGEKFVKAVPQPSAAQEGARFSTNSLSELLDTTRYITRIIKLTNALPRDVAPALQPFAKAPNSIMAIDSAGILVLRDYEENIKRMLEMLEQIDVVAINEVDPVVIPIKYALAGDIAQVLGSLTAGGGGGTTVGRQPNRSGLSTGGLGGGGGGGGGFGQQGYGGQPGQQGYNQGNPQGGAAGGLNSSSAGRSSFANRLNQIVNKAAGGSGDIVVLGQTKIIADERTNSLLIFANKQDIATIRDIIDKLDVVLAQVIIEALIVEVTLGDKFELGFDYIQKGHSVGPVRGSSSINRPLPLTSTGVTNAAGQLSGFFNYFAKLDKYNLEASATASASDSKVRILSRPRVQTSHAVEANLFVGRTRPYPTGSSYGGFNGGAYSSIQQLQIGITLSVLPLINPDGLVVMDIRQKVQDVGQEITIANIGTVPETIEREANAKVAVKDGETVMLGGFISSSASDTKGGVPFLKDIPILGNLFRSTTKKKDRVELMVLIRPTVLPTPDIAARVATEERNKLPDMMRAEREDQEVQRKGVEAEKRRQEGLGKSARAREGFTETSVQPQGVSKAELAAERKRQDRAAKELLRKEGFE